MNSEKTSGTHTFLSLSLSSTNTIALEEENDVNNKKMAGRSDVRTLVEHSILCGYEIWSGERRARG